MFFDKIYDYIQNSAEYPEPGLGDEDNMRTLIPRPVARAEVTMQAPKTNPQ